MATHSAFFTLDDHDREEHLARADHFRGLRNLWYPQDERAKPSPFRVVRNDAWWVPPAGRLYHPDLLDHPGPADLILAMREDAAFLADAAYPARAQAQSVADAALVFLTKSETRAEDLLILFIYDTLFNRNREQLCEDAREAADEAVRCCPANDLIQDLESSLVLPAGRDSRFNFLLTKDLLALGRLVQFEAEASAVTRPTPARSALALHGTVSKAVLSMRDHGLLPSVGELGKIAAWARTQFAHGVTVLILELLRWQVTLPGGLRVNWKARR